MTTVGTGKYSYRLEQDWAKLPPGEEFGTVSAVATDSQDRVYVFQRKDPPVVVFDREGNFLSSWGNGNFENPHGIFIADDIIYLTDREGSVAMKYTLEGQPLQIIGTRGAYSDTGSQVSGEVVPRSAGPFNFLTEMVPSPSGDLYISDGYRNARVHRFTSDGTLINSWGEPGKSGPNQMHLPHSLIVGDDGRVYVCDRETAGFRSSTKKANSSPCGPICSDPWTFQWTQKGCFTSASGLKTINPLRLAYWTGKERYWPAGPPARPTVLGLTPTEISTWR